MLRRARYEGRRASDIHLDSDDDRAVDQHVGNQCRDHDKRGKKDPNERWSSWLY